MAECRGPGCYIACPNGCGCIGYSDGAWCECFCNEAPFKIPTKFDQADPEKNVDFCAKDMPLTYLASYFDFLFPGQILIPASKTHGHRKLETGKTR
ncbi:hypothetical protein [Brevibacillus daliensis]|uniref:hypothetical protein n=1 Tax=Brevibacillus daliensis TaxID=2892995 RepID=UPI001E334CC9|nr:hypothetical protein [Brevibacillus daliensis]